MAIRITGMYSGLDTESIINELASAQSYKKNKLVKAQTKLSWKQDAWKALNTKIYSFYQKLDDLRLQSSYMKKKTVVSNANAIQVTGTTGDGTHSVKVKQLSKKAALTSGNLSNNGVNYTGNATLAQLDKSLAGKTGSIRISDRTGQYVDIEVSGDMKINDFVKKVSSETALSASYDQDNQRIYISSWASGAAGDFFFSGNDEGGMQALKALKLLSDKDIDKLTAEGGEYNVWSKYTDDDGKHTAAYDELIKAETLSRLQALKAQNDKLAKENADYIKANQDNIDKLKEIQANADGTYDDHYAYLTGYDFDNMTVDDIKAAGEALYDKIYGEETEQKVQAKNEDGSLKFEADGTTPVYVQAKDENGEPKVDDDENPVYETETVRVGGMSGDLKDLQKDLADKKEALAQARKDLAADSENAALQQAVKDAEDAVTAASEAVSKKQTEINKAKEVYSFYTAYAYNEAKREANQKKIDENNTRFDYTEDENGKGTYMEKDEDGNKVAIGAGITADEVTEQFDAKVEAAKDVMAHTADWKEAALGTKVAGQDSEIEVDGVTYTSRNDSVTVNGMTVTAMEVTDKEVTVSTKTDTEGVYNMIKDFIKAYSELINEMDSLYNAESSSGYDPLLSEEKEALSDSEIEEWEKKIKDSLLRRDATLSDISSALKMDMMTGFKIGNQTIYLSDFGIATLGYFNSADNEKNAYHIDGDPDDAKTKNNDDLLNKLIANNPDAVMEFFTGLTNKLHDTLANKMSATTMSSAMTVYNDKKMKEDYDDYTDKIKKQEEKLNNYIDKWYSKFSAMETALAKLESKNSSLSSLFGG